VPGTYSNWCILIVEMPGPGRGRGSANRYRFAPQTKLAKIRNVEAVRSRLPKQTGKSDGKDNVTDKGSGGFFSGFKRTMEMALPPAKRIKLYHRNSTPMSEPHPKCQTKIAAGAVVADKFGKFVEWLLPRYNNRKWRIENGLVIANWKQSFLQATTNTPGTIVVFNLSTTNNLNGASGTNVTDKQIVLSATLFRQQQQSRIHDHRDHDATRKEHTKTTAATSPTTTTTTTPCSSQVHPTYQLHARAYLNFDMTSASVVGRWTDATTDLDIFCHMLDRLCCHETRSNEIHVLRDEESFRQADQDGRLNHRCEKALCLFATEPAWITGPR
jgi:hypothetical protein